MQLRNTATEQYEQLIANFDSVLSQFNSSLDDAVKVICYFTHAISVKLHTRITQKFANKPCLMIVVEKLPRDAQIELEVLVNVGKDKKSSFESIEVPGQYAYKILD